MRTRTSIALFLCFLATPLYARIVRIEIDAVIPELDGYDRIVGVAYGEVDPMDRRNAIIQDIELAPRNARGAVEYAMNFTILRPPGGGNGLLYHEAVNIGFALTELPPFLGGIGQLARERGYTLVFSGWQGDIVPIDVPGLPQRHFIQLPEATLDGQDVTGRIRVDYVVTAPAPSLPLGGLSSGFPNVSYFPVDLSGDGSVLTRRIHRTDQPVVVPSSEWAFSDCSQTPFPGDASRVSICLAGGFEPASIYELSYVAQKPLVLGLGFAATRDFIAFLRHAPADDGGTPNPIAGATRAAVLFGTSQSGVYARQFIHLGFNEDEQGRRVFEGVHPDLAANRHPLNIRFRPQGAPRQHANFRPSMETPTTYRPMFDPLSRRVGWIFERCARTRTCPKIVQTYSSAEYWNDRASLTTTDPLGWHDIRESKRVRMYLLSGTEHTTAAPQACQQPTNPNDKVRTLRALTVALEKWVLAGEAPPDTRIPRLRDRSLVRPEELSWPTIPGVTYSGVVNDLPLVDYGPGFDAEDVSGVLGERKVHPWKRYRVLVPEVDGDGNEIAGIRNATIQAPVGTYTGWNLRKPGFGEGDLCDAEGSFIPFAETMAEREAVGDPRLSLQERYGSHEGYVEAVRDAAERLVAERFLLPEDAEAVIAEAEASDVLR